MRAYLFVVIDLCEVVVFDKRRQECSEFIEL